MISLKIIIQLALVSLFCLLFIWLLHLDWKFSQIKPIKCPIIKAYDKDRKTEVTDFSKASYYTVRLPNGVEKPVQRRDFVSANQTDIYVRYDGKTCQMYRESSTYYGKEHTLAMLRPSRGTIRTFVICCVICLLFVFNSIESRYSSESKHLRQIAEEKQDEFESIVEKNSYKGLGEIFDDIIVESFSVFLPEHKTKSSYIQIIYLCDAGIMLFDSRGTISEPPDIKSPFFKRVLKAQYTKTEKEILLLRDYKLGRITKEEALGNVDSTSKFTRGIYFEIGILIILKVVLSVICVVGLTVSIGRSLIYAFMLKKYQKKLYS